MLCLIFFFPKLGAVGELEWSENWVSFMDTMLQFSLIQKNARGLYLPTRLQRVVIDPVHHLSVVSPGKGDIHCRILICPMK